uniref:Spatacsin C-terminal domain-containing protein n=1 Tax=Tetranychus urticae TaxID=32264 RepID=T1KZF7_TETUR
MEFAVLELGLKNKQIFNVTSFLRIQVEAFKVNWEKLCSSKDGVEDEVCHSLFDDWEKVFSKILIILKTNLHGNQSPEEKEFGRRLARISLQTSNSLLEILSQEETNLFINASLDREKVYFINSLINQINLIRNTIGAVINPKETVVSDVNPQHDNIFVNWSGMSKQHILINCIKEQCLPLGQYYIIHKMKEDLTWSTINETALRAILNHLKANELNQAENIISGLGFDHKFVIKFVLEHSFLEKLRFILVQKLNQDDHLPYERLTLIERVNEPFHLKLSFSCIKAVKPINQGDLLTYGIFQENVVNRTSCIKVVEPHQIWSYLVKTNRCNLLLMWINRYFGNYKTNDFQDGSVFSSKISQQMIDELVSDGQDHLRESTLSALGNFGVFSSYEMIDMQLLIRRLFRSCHSERTGTLTGFKDHPLFNKTTMITYDKFHQRFIEYCADNSLHQILYWSYVQNEFQVDLEKCTIDKKLKNLLPGIKTWNEDPLKDYFTMNSILEVARYLFDLETPVNLQSLLDNHLGKLAILASQFAPKGTLSFLGASKDELWYAKKESLLPAMEKHYPLLFLAIKSIKELNLPSISSPGSEFPSIYTLLNNTIILDVTRLFSWQTTNHFRNTNDPTILGELPHFSHPKLVGLGLKANLTFIYHLKKGRPFEAFTRYMQNKTQRPSPKKIEIVCKRAALLAFYNCTSLEITSACVTFLELFKLNSANLRLHLAIGYLIMSHAGKYLGLETKNQSIELGNLLRKAYYHSEKGAITHIMELLLTSFSRKYPEGECTIDECVEYQLAISFSNQYKLDLPLNFLNKCIDNGDWLMFTVYAQFYEYPKEVICKQLNSFSGCIPEHLEKAFSSSMVTSEKKSSQSIVRRRVTESRDTLYSRLGLLKTATAQRQAPRQVSTPTMPLAVSPDDDRSSVISETDLETASVASSSMIGDLPESPDFDPDSPPKDLFNLVLTCQRYHPTEPGRSLLLASLSLSNPIPALIAASLYSNSENESVYSIFDCFCCWLHSSFSLDFKPRSPSSYNSIIWNQQDFNAMIQNALQVSSNFLVFRNGLRIFAAPNNPLSDLIQYFIEFLVEKDYYDSVKKLKTFQECLWNYKKDQDDRGLLSSKAWIEETSIIILSNGLKAVDCEFELNILLRHLDFARLQSSFDEQTSVPDFRKLYRLSQCLQDTDLKLSIPDLLSTQSGTKKYNDSILEVVYSLQDKGFYSEAQQFAAITEINEEKIFINEWRKKILKDASNFSLWKSCFIDLEKRQIDLTILRSFIAEFRNSVESELIKAFIHAKDFYYATRLECDPVETTINEIDLWTN